MDHPLPDQASPQTECPPFYSACSGLVAKHRCRPVPRLLGGEVAAGKLTGYLKPVRITLYLDGKADELILANRLRPDLNGAIELLEAFWTTDEMGHRNDVAPPLLVYADLMASSDPRNIEAAKMIRANELAQVDHAQ